MYNLYVKHHTFIYMSTYMVQIEGFHSQKIFLADLHKEVVDDE